MNDKEPYVQLQMVWPAQRFNRPPAVQLAPGYHLRTHQPGDDAAFFELMALAGWPGWDEARLRPWLPRIPPHCWFMAVHSGSGTLAASAMGLHDDTDLHPGGGELGWVAGNPAHAGHGLGLAVSAAVTARLLELDYRNIHLYTEHWRLAALKSYLTLGYVPFLYLPEMWERWWVICEQLSWPFTPEQWR